jgi:large subunit ribosomal protein L1
MAKKISKRKEALLAKIDKEKNYSLEEAVNTIKDLKSAKFDETVEIALNLNVDPRHADQMIRSSVVLPHGTGKNVTVAAFAKGDKIDEAKEAGADIIGDDELLAKIQNGEIDFDIIVATPDMMGVLGRVARILGPKGLMPNPKAGTVTPDLVSAIKEIAAGKFEFKTDKQGNVHAVFGKLSFGAKKLEENLEYFLKTIEDVKPTGAKGKYINSVYICDAMGPSIKIDMSTEA